MAPNKLTRRQALKYILAASGGLTAAAFLPAKWLKPVVSAGVLPVHARASVAPAHDCVSYLIAFNDLQYNTGDGITLPLNYVGLTYIFLSPAPPSGATFTFTAVGSLGADYLGPASSTSTPFNPADFGKVFWVGVDHEPFSGTGTITYTFTATDGNCPVGIKTINVIAD